MASLLQTGQCALTDSLAAVSRSEGAILFGTPVHRRPPAGIYIHCRWKASTTRPPITPQEQPTPRGLPAPASTVSFLSRQPEPARAQLPTARHRRQHHHSVGAATGGCHYILASEGVARWRGGDRSDRIYRLHVRPVPLLRLSTDYHSCANPRRLCSNW